MNKTILKIFAIFVLSASFIATVLLAINFMGFAIIGSDTAHDHETSPKRILANISENLTRDSSGFHLTEAGLVPPDCWCILIDANGSIIWAKNQPTDIPEQYTLNDIARMTRWYLNDYPVYVQTVDDGLLVLGLPKNSLGKYDITYSMDWFDTLPQRILGVVLLNLCLAMLLALLLGSQLYRRLKQLMNGISDLQQEKSVKLKEKGIFKEICRNLNQTSQIIERKNRALHVRDAARSNWIAGISHDIRTPLAVVTGYAESLADCGELSDENEKKARAVLANSIKIKRLIEDLNLISSMEYDMQPSRKSPVKICPLLRGVVTEFLNNGLSEAFVIYLDLNAEKAVVPGDGPLLERAFYNLINNAVQHNPDGCTIQIKAGIHDKEVHILISDNGRGVSEDVIKNITEIPKAAHGLGLPMAYKIISVHSGSMKVYNQDGFCIKITLPLSQKSKRSEKI